MPDWIPGALPLLGSGGIAVLVAAWLVYKASKRRNTDLAKRERDQTLAERFDDASELARYIREEVERQVKPIRDEMEKVKTESHEMHDAVRAYFTALWAWDQKGRLGPLPTLPVPILKRLGLEAFVTRDDQL